MNIERKKGSFHDLVFTVDLSQYNKVEGDIADIIFLVKENPSDADADALMDKKQSLGDIAFTSPDIISVTWDSNEYDNFSIGQLYYAGLFIKFTGDSSFDENVDTIFRIKILQDFTEQ